MKDEISKQLAKISIVDILLCAGLLFVAWKAYQTGDLLRAYVLVFTTNIITLVYLFGTRKLIKQLQGHK